MRKSYLIWTLVIGGGFMFVFLVALLSLVLLLSSNDDGVSGLGFGLPGDRIAVIDIEGVIFDSKPFSEQVKKFVDDPRVKAIILRIDSPGGGVAASQEIYSEIKRLREEKKKRFVVSMGSVAASGGYYIACAADKIVANPGTVTGSIGVIAEWYNYEELLKLARLKPEVFKSGKFKDTGSPTRRLTEEEKAYFQGLIDQMYNQFLNAVIEARNGKKNLTDEHIRKLADGRVYTGQEAVDVGLVDELGDLQEAIRIAARLVGISGEPQVVTPPKPRPRSLLDLLMSSDIADNITRLVPEQLRGPNSGAAVQFEYLWK